MTHELIEAGLRQHQAGRLEDAQRLYESALAQEPQQPDALHLLGVVALQRGDATRALALIGQAIEAQPGNAHFHANRAQACLALERIEEARVSFERACALEPREPGFALGAAACLARQGRLPQAEAALRRIVEQHARFARAWYNLANAVREQERPQEALELFRRAIELEPGFPDAHAGVGNALHALQRFEEAEQAYGRFLALRPDAADGWCNLASVRLDRGRFDEAAQACERGLALSPDSADLHWVLGSALSGAGRLRASVGAFGAASRLAPRDARRMSAYGSALHETGRVREGLQRMEHALALDPQSHDLRHVWSGALLKGGDLDRGWDAYESRPARQSFLARAAGPMPLRELPASLTGRTICVLREQGLGDELFFLRYVQPAAARGARIVCRASAKIASLLERVPFLERVITQDESLPAADFVLLAGDLPRALGEFPASPARARQDVGGSGPPRLLRVFFPELPPALPLVPLPGQLERMRHELDRLGPPPYLGLTWRGGIAPEEQRGASWSLHKQIPLAGLGEALRGVAGTAIALQRHPRPEEIADLSVRLGRPVHDLSALNEDLEAMLALLALVDEYVGVSNTNMHLRAGVGRTARVLVPQPPEWRWMAVGEASPWFPGFRVYRQHVDGEWRDALARLSRDL
jgi:tetratricopeptide (TPR) repeat protein